MPKRMSKAKQLELMTRPSGEKDEKFLSGKAIRGRMSAYAYFVQACREEHRRLFPNETVEFTAFTRKCSECWKKMTETEKERFHKLATKDKLRYQLEMQLKGVTDPVAKDKSAPKRAVTAFFFYSQEERSKVRKENPTMGVGDISKEVSKRWKALSDSARAKFEQKAEKDKARYQKELEVHKKSNDAKKNDEDDEETEYEEILEDSDDSLSDEEDPDDDGRQGSDFEEEDEYRDENEDLPFNII